MDVRFGCAKCGLHITIEEQVAGTTVNCPGCGEAVTVPALSTLPPKAGEAAKVGSFLCQECHRQLWAAPSKAGSRAACPHCGRELQVPKFLSQPSPPDRAEVTELGENEAVETGDSSLVGTRPYVSIDTLGQALVDTLGWRKIVFAGLGALPTAVVCGFLGALSLQAGARGVFQATQDPGASIGVLGIFLLLIDLLVLVGIIGVVAGGISFMANEENEGRGCTVGRAVAFCRDQFLALFGGTLLHFIRVWVVMVLVNLFIFWLSRRGGWGSKIAAALFAPHVLFNVLMIVLLQVIVLVPCAIAVEKVGALTALRRVNACVRRYADLLLVQCLLASAFFVIFGSFLTMPLFLGATPMTGIPRATSLHSIVSAMGGFFPSAEAQPDRTVGVSGNQVLSDESATRNRATQPFLGVPASQQAPGGPGKVVGSRGAGLQTWSYGLLLLLVCILLGVFWVCAFTRFYAVVAGGLTESAAQEIGPGNVAAETKTEAEDTPDADAELKG